MQRFSGHEAYKEFATYKGKTQSARHIKPLHWYIACRLVLEGGFHPDDITPRPPFKVTEVKGRKKRLRYMLSHEPALGSGGEQIILGGLKTKNVDVVVNRRSVGPVIAVSCKGVTKAFRNLQNRMEETIGECTNLHITYPAMVVGYFAILRANRTLEDAISAPEDEDITEEEPEISPVEAASAPGENATEASQMDDAAGASSYQPLPALSERKAEIIKANDIAVNENGDVAEGIKRFHSALSEMTGRRGIRDEISRYEAMTMALIEPRGDVAGNILPHFPPQHSPLHLSSFFETLYRRYEERFIFGAPLLAERSLTTRMEWDPESPVFRNDLGAETQPVLDFQPRIGSAQ